MSHLVVVGVDVCWVDDAVGGGGLEQVAGSLQDAAGLGHLQDPLQGVLDGRRYD
jgi:hypothetical protein